jgi:hypothetical protein
VGAQLRFTVTTVTGCRVWIVCAEDSGEIVRVHPSGDEPESIPRGGSTAGLEAARADERGLERWYAICSPAPLAYSRVEASVRDAVGGGARVKDPAPLSGLPAGTALATVLVSKG